ncbi:MAG: MFS transporter [Thermoanaerobaculia bacterium]|nr:MFS transporter [Thermoanaerobaculia bacterium]
MPSREDPETPPDGPRRAALIARLEAAGSYPRWVLIAAISGMFATGFPVTILTVSLRSIAIEMETTETVIAWVISAPILLSAVALPLLGKIGDMRGHRRIFLVGSLASVITAFLTVAAWDAASLIVLRTLAAVLGAATQPSSMALIFTVYGPLGRSRAMGWWSMAGAAAPALGLIAGGPLVDALGWRVVFLIQGLLGIPALVLAWLVLRETPARRVRFDVWGSLSLAVSMAALMLSLSLVRDAGLAAPRVWLTAAVGAAGLGAFVAVERRTRQPLLPLQFFAYRNFTAPILANGLMGAAYMGAFVLAPLVLLEIFGGTITSAALIMLLRTSTLTVASLAGGYFADRVGERRGAIIGTAIMTLALVVLAAGILDRSLLLFGAGLMLQGLGHGLALPPMNSAIADAVPHEDLGIASAASRLMAQVGTAFGITLFTLALGGRSDPAAFAAAFAVGVALSALSTLTAAGMQKRSVV